MFMQGLASIRPQINRSVYCLLFLVGPPVAGYGVPGLHVDALLRQARPPEVIDALLRQARPPEVVDAFLRQAGPRRLVSCRGIPGF